MTAAGRGSFFFILMSEFQLFQVLLEPASPTPMETSGCEPADLCQAFSDVILHTAIRDVDADDYENPMLCSEYVKDIYKYLRQLEVSDIFRLIFFCYIVHLFRWLTLFPVTSGWAERQTHLSAGQGGYWQHAGHSHWLACTSEPQVPSAAGDDVHDCGNHRPVSSGGWPC